MSTATVEALNQSIYVSRQHNRRLDSIDTQHRNNSTEMTASLFTMDKHSKNLMSQVLNNERTDLTAPKHGQGGVSNGALKLPEIDLSPYKAKHQEVNYMKGIVKGKYDTTTPQQISTAKLKEEFAIRLHNSSKPDKKRPYQFRRRQLNNL